MFKKSKILKKLGAGFMAGLCAFSIEHEKFELETFDNVLIRKLIECIKVLSKTEILVIFKGGYEVRTEIE